MNNTARNSRSNAFLLELIIVVLFFAVAAAVLLQIFARADALSRDASALSYAVIAAEDAAERQRSLPLGQLQPSRIYYDREWQPSSENDAAFAVDVTPDFEVHDGGSLASFSITVSGLTDGKPVYSLETKKYYAGEYPEGVRHEE